MKINEKTLLTFANSKPVDKEGYLMKRGEVNKAFQRRWFVLKGNLLFYFEKRGAELLGMIILEGCVIELAENESEKYCFHINFMGNRAYVLSADDQDTLESWMRALTCSGFDYMRLMVAELQRQLEELDKASLTSTSSSQEPSMLPPIPPRRLNPFNKSYNGNDVAMTSNNQQVPESSVTLRPAPPPPNNRVCSPSNFGAFRDDDELLIETKEVEKNEFTFARIHEEIGRPILLAMRERKALKESADQPLILL